MPNTRSRNKRKLSPGAPSSSDSMKAQATSTRNKRQRLSYTTEVLPHQPHRRQTAVQGDTRVELQQAESSRSPGAKAVCFRISNVPAGWTKAKLLQLLQRENGAADRFTINENQLSIFQACCGDSQTALLKTTECPQYLAELRPEQERIITEENYDLVVDKHFYGLTPLNAPGGEIFADVVAVTGLAGHPYGSWMNRSSNRMWLHDLLPQDVQGLRIMIYGYNSELVGPNTSSSRILDHRRDLAEVLSNARSSPKEKDRPIIFLGHSLGGIVILQALVQSKRQPLHRHIIDATRAIFFFGTPHHGMRIEELEKMVKDMSSGPESQSLKLLQQLEEGSEFLESQKEELIPLWDGLRVFSYYETVKTPTVGKSARNNRYGRIGRLETMVKSISAQLYLRNEHRLPVDRNHTDMVKFATRCDRSYESISMRMKECIDSIQDERILWKKKVDEATRKKIDNCLKILNIEFSTFCDRRDELLSKRHKDTFSWFINDHRYRNWVDFDSEQQKFLWIHGKPGAGKSMLSAFLANEICENWKKYSCTKFSIAYFFCKGTDERLRTLAAILKHLLAQLLAQDASVLYHFQQESDYQEKGEKTQWTEGMLLRVFKRVWSDNKLRICLIIDALDECEEQDRDNFPALLRDLVKDASANKKLLITSRPNISVITGFDKLALDKVSDSDIREYITNEIHDLTIQRGFNSLLEEEICDSLVNGADGMFLWASLIINDLKNTRQTNANTIRKKLSTLPKDITTLYRRILDDIEKKYEDSADKDQARKAIQCIVYAKRPLTLDELKTAIAVLPTHTSMEDMEDYVEHDIKWFLQSTFESLLVIREDEVINLVHQSAKDFLMGFDLESQHTSSRTPSLDPRFRFGLTSKDADITLSIACLSYLCFDVFDIGPSQCENSYNKAPVTYSEIEKKHKFVHYAALYWPEHAPKANLSEIQNLDLLNVFQMAARSERKLKFAYQIYVFAVEPLDGFRPTNLLLIAARLGVFALIQIFLKNGADVNAQGEIGSALQLAAEYGHETVVKLLIESGAEVNAEGGYLGNALQRAAEYGHETVVKLLIESGVEVNAQCERGNALQLAAEYGHETVVKLLIDSGAEVNAQGGYHGHALQAAAYGGNENVVKLLIDSGADVNAQGGVFGNALLTAIECNYENVVKLLVDSGAEIDPGEALRAAASRDNEAMSMEP